jgi:hypothetical protein
VFTGLAAAALPEDFAKAWLAEAARLAGETEREARWGA